MLAATRLPPYMRAQACPRILWAIPTTDTGVVIMNSKVVSDMGGPASAKVRAAALSELAGVRAF